MKEDKTKIHLFMEIQEKGSSEKKWHRIDIEPDFEVVDSKIHKTRICAGLPDGLIPKWEKEDGQICESM